MGALLGEEGTPVSRGMCVEEGHTCTPLLNGPLPPSFFVLVYCIDFCHYPCSFLCVSYPAFKVFGQVAKSESVELFP